MAPTPFSFSGLAFLASSAPAPAAAPSLEPVESVLLSRGAGAAASLAIAATGAGG
jgi:hypothetical protein